MKAFRDLLVTQLDAFQLLYWQKLPLYQYAPRITSFLSIKLGKEFESLLALPKVGVEKDGKKVIIWRSDEISGQIMSLDEWIKKGGIQEQALAERKIKQVEDFIANLLTSSSEEDKTWGNLLQLCFSDISSTAVFIEGDKIVIAGWGLRPIAPTENTVFSAPHERKLPPPPVEEIIPQPRIVTEEDSNLNVTEEDSNLNVTEEDSNLNVTEEDVPFVPETAYLDELHNASGNSNTPGNVNPTAAQKTSHSETFSQDTPHPSFAEKGDKKASDGTDERTIASAPPGKSGTQLFFDFFKRWWWVWLLLLLFSLIFWKTCNTSKEVVYRPSEPNIIIPIDSNDIVFADDSISMVVSDRLNVALRGSNKDIDAFARAFKAAYPDPAYSIIYYDTLTSRIQIQIPAEQRSQMAKELPGKLPEFEMLIWHESIFSNEALPTDPGFGDRNKAWYIDAIKVAGAWGKSFGDKNITVAIIDDGFDLRHEEFAGKITKAWNVLDRSPNVFANAKTMHGSHVGGTAIANKNNSAGLSGIAPDCNFMPIQVADANGIISMTAVIDGILYAINQGADVINLSLGLKTNPLVSAFPISVQRDIIANTFHEEELFWKEIFAIAEENNVAVVIAGGNDNVLVGLDPMQRSDYTINVAALSPDLKKAQFSNFGELSSLSAPGVQIYSSVPNNRYTFMDGTSMAAPIVAGAVALIKSIRPDLKPREIKNLLQNTGLYISEFVGPLIQLDRAVDNINNPDAITNPGEMDCNAISQKIDSLQQEIERLRRLCPDAGAQDTMKMPDIIEDLDFSLGRWKSTTSIHNDKGEEVTLFFDFFPNQSGKLTLVEPSGLECAAQLSLKANRSSFDANQIKEAVCARGQGSYSEYTFTCEPDANGYAQCVAQNKRVKANRFPFKLVKIR